MQEEMRKQLEEQRKIQKEKEEALKKLLDEQKKREEELKKLEKERKRKQEETERRKREEEERKRLRLQREREEQFRKKQEELEKKRKRIKICNRIKNYINNKYYYEAESLSVYKLNQIHEFGYIKAPDYWNEVKIELLKTEKIDMPAQSFKTLTGNISGTLSGKIITGWKLINRHDNENGGDWKRNGKILGTSNYSFTFTSCFWRGIYWTVELYGVTIPQDYYENKDLNEYDYY